MHELYEKIIKRLDEKSRFYNSASDIDQNIRSGVIIAKEVVQEEFAEYDRRNSTFATEEQEAERDV